MLHPTWLYLFIGIGISGCAGVPIAHRIQNGESMQVVQQKLGEPSRVVHYDTSQICKIRGVESQFKDGKGIPIWLYEKEAPAMGVVFDPEGRVMKVAPSAAIKIGLDKMMVRQLREFVLQVPSEVCKDTTKSKKQQCLDDYRERSEVANRWIEAKSAEIEQRESRMRAERTRKEAADAEAYQLMLQGTSEIGHALASPGR